MSVRSTVRALGATVGLLVALIAFIGAPTAGAAPAPAPLAVRTIYYDASGAQEFQAAVNQGAAAWNAAVPEIKFVPATGSQATVRIYADDGWPRTYPGGFGRGTVYMGREAVVDGFYPPRIAAHELGHILGLPDNRNGRCDYLMSGHSSPTSCTSTTPHATEIAQVRQNATALAGPAVLAVREAGYADCFVF